MTCKDLLLLKISLYLKSPNASSCAAQLVGLWLEAARKEEGGEGGGRVEGREKGGEEKRGRGKTAQEQDRSCSLFIT